MIGVSGRGTFSAEERYLLKKATEMVRSVDEKAICRRFPAFENIRCHELARAVGKLLRLRVVDGYVVETFGIGDHSWLLTPAGNILDVYSVAQLPMVQLVKQERHALAKTHQEGPLTLGQPIHKGVVDALVKMMGEEEQMAQAKAIYNGAFHVKESGSKPRIRSKRKARKK
jgi:hypothetical protein